MRQGGGYAYGAGSDFGAPAASSSVKVKLMQLVHDVKKYLPRKFSGPAFAKRPWADAALAQCR